MTSEALGIFGVQICVPLPPPKKKNCGPVRPNTSNIAKAAPVCWYQISKTTGDRDSVTTEHLQKMTYGESNGHVILTSEKLTVKFGSVTEHLCQISLKNRSGTIATSLTCIRMS